MTSILHRKTLILISLGVAGLIVAEPVRAQPRGRPAEAVIVSAAPIKNWRDVLTGSHISSAIVITASVPVSYHDLNLRQDPDVDRFHTRIDVAANLVCRELDLRYPTMVYPRLDDGNCVDEARKDGDQKADEAVNNARK